MTRELKFRVWDGAEMVHDVTVGKFGVFYVNPANNGLDPNDSASITPSNTKYDEGTPVMQFTGRTDLTPPWEDTPRPRSIELFEGDIADAWVSRYPDNKTRGVVVWNDYAQAFQLRYPNIMGGHANEFLHHYHFFEIIGNIYKNPELVHPLTH